MSNDKGGAQLSAGYSDLLLAVKPFISIIMDSSGRIPYEKLSAENWRDLCNAYRTGVDEKFIFESILVEFYNLSVKCERLRGFAYSALAQAHQVIWEIDEQYPAHEQADKERAAMAQSIEGLPPVPRDIYDNLVRDAMQFRSQTPPKPA
jgi:hypothetical protein